MKRVSIIGLGWLGMPLAVEMAKQGWQVRGSKTTHQGVTMASDAGVESYLLALTPGYLPHIPSELLSVDTLIITLPASQIAANNMSSVHYLVNGAQQYGVTRIIFTSSTSVYGTSHGVISEQHALQPVTNTARHLVALEQWLRALPGVKVDVLRLAGLVGEQRHPGRFLAGKVALTGGQQKVNLVHATDVITAIIQVLSQTSGGELYNLCAPEHPERQHFYTEMASRLNLIPPDFQPEEHHSDRIIDGSKICRHLNFDYQYPDPFTMPVS